MVLKYLLLAHERPRSNRVNEGYLCGGDCDFLVSAIQSTNHYEGHEIKKHRGCVVAASPMDRFQAELSADRSIAIYCCNDKDIARTCGVFLWTEL